MNLQRLVVDRLRNLRNECLSYLTPLRSLRTLRLSPAAGGGLDDFGVTLLAELPGLRSLSIPHCSIDGFCFSPFSASRHLETLCVYSCNISDEHCTSIASIASLRYLDIHRNPVANKGLVELSVMVGLRVLDVSMCRVSKVACLTLMTSLKKVDLTGTDVTELDLDVLRRSSSSLEVVKLF